MSIRKINDVDNIITTDCGRSMSDFIRTFFNTTFKHTTLCI